MPNALEISSITIVASAADDDSAARDRPITGNDLETLGVSDNFLAASGFEAKVGQAALLPEQSPIVIAIGLGTDEPSAADIRTAASALWRACAQLESVTTLLPLIAAPALGAEVALQAVIEGLLLASYRFDELKGSPEATSQLNQVTLVAPDGVDGDLVLARAGATAEAIALTRDLVNRPGGSLTATQLADEAVAVGESSGLEVELWDRERLAQEGCGGILGVNAGSSEEPRLVRLTWRPEDESRATLHLVGKGITFDTGGLNLKTFEGMKEMKIDMGGAAAVIGAMKAIAAHSPDVTVIGTCCCTDNQPGPTATKPGDVLHIRNGKTVEVLNTDAEGRLVLADGLSLATEDQPDLIIDLATLTGACLVALGQRYAGLMGNDEQAISRVQTAARQAGERVWHLPLPTEYRKQLDSQTADLSNIGSGRFGGTLIAGLFLQEFVGDTPWVHLDIAGPVTTDEIEGEFAKGATGFGVRTLLEIATGW
ncbi:MAG TPA: leucyl aminopeptidase [Acidimicrobiales bacterium]|jgi:leucyl aminopeptidase|nr:leucyl aminopeptidase [Acidimicrobiales bacterium]